MVLKQDVALGVVAEVVPVLVFAVGHERVPHLVAALIFQHFLAVEPVLHMVAAHDDGGGVPSTDVERLFLGSRDEVVERRELAVALHSEFCVGVALVVENLELAADGRSLTLVLRRVDEVFDAAVCSLGYLEVHA